MEYNYNMASIYHILPSNDSDEHEESEECKCHPEVTWVTEDYCIIVHNSFDKREYIETLINNICLN